MSRPRARIVADIGPERMAAWGAIIAPALNPWEKGEKGDARAAA